MAVASRAANEDVVRRIFDAFAQKQGFALRGLFAPDAVWTVPGDGTMAGVHRGREAIFRFLARLPKETDGTTRSQLVDVLASDDARSRALPRLRRAPRPAARPRPGAALPARGRAGHRGARAAVRPRRVREPSGPDTSRPRAAYHLSPMSAPAIAAGRPTVRIRGTAYPVLLPTLRDPRLHLAGRDRHAAGARADRVRLQPLDRADPRLARHVRRARGRRSPSGASTS